MVASADLEPATGEKRFDAAGFEAFLKTRREPAWLIEQRREAWAAFERLEWPNRRGEEWMRTDIRLFKLDSFRLPFERRIEMAPGEGSLAQGVNLVGQCVSYNSNTDVAQFTDKWEKKGVLFGPLDRFAASHSDLLRKHLFTRVLDPHYDKFAALHAACWTGGLLLYVPRGVTIDEPFHALAKLGAGGVDLGHTLVILEDGASATLLTETRSLDNDDGSQPPAAGFHCGGTELIVGPGANLRFVSLQDWGPGVWHFAHQKAIVEQDGQLQWTIGALGARLAKVNQQVGLVGPGAHCQVNGAMFTEGKQHLAYHTLQHHEAPHCRSDFLYKAALQDKSRTVWRGLIKVDPGAIKTDGYQRNDNLMLSSHARADSIPGLEIEADDVRCTHGSTSGRVDEELIFYACCRGYTRQEAIRMIVTGFFQQIFDRITIDSVREALGRAIARRVREYE